MNPIIIIGGIALAALVVSQMNQEPPPWTGEDEPDVAPALLRAPLDAPVPVLPVELPRRV